MDNIIPSYNKAFGSYDYELSKVRSPIIRDRLFAVLDNPEAGRYDRLWFAGFLKSVGYSLEDICSIIDELTSWSNYDPGVTWLQVRSVFHGTAKQPRFLHNVPRSGGVVPPEGADDHHKIQLSVFNEWCLLNKSANLEFEVFDRGDGRRGFVDVALFDDDLRIGVEIDKASPKLKSIFKMKYFDIAVFILRSPITDYRKRMIESKLEEFDKPFVLILLFERLVINRIPFEYNNVSLFFRTWMANYGSVPLPLNDGKRDRPYCARLFVNCRDCRDLIPGTGCKWTRG